MRIDKVVVNASPLITLFQSGQAGLLPQLFQKIIVPGAVWTEVTGGERDDAAARELIVQPWPVREIVMTSPRVAAWNLGDGESSVLSYALEYPASRAVVDDAEALRTHTRHTYAGNWGRSRTRQTARVDCLCR